MFEPNAGPVAGGAADAGQLSPPPICQGAFRGGVPSRRLFVRCEALNTPRKSTPSDGVRVGVLRPNPGISGFSHYPRRRRNLRRRVE